MLGKRSAVALIATSLCSSQTEDQALLSENKDQVDHRPWTQQHLVAADVRLTPSLALTPPQGEQDAHCMDVNVRGPGMNRNTPKHNGNDLHLCFKIYGLNSNISRCYCKEIDN